jgi:hypothetical protein
LAVEAFDLLRSRCFASAANAKGRCLVCNQLMLKPTRSLYFENSAGRIWEEPAGYIRLEYHAGVRDVLQFKALLTHTAQALSRRQWSKMLVDQRNMAPYNPSEQDWMTTEWLPRAVNESGYRHGAIMVAHNVFARLATNQFIMASRELPHTYRTFEAEDAAVTWLLASERK